MPDTDTTDERPDYGRALLTDRQREILADEADVDAARRRDEAQRVRYRIRERLPRDIELLARYEGRDGTLLDELRAVVCSEADAGESGDDEP